MNILILFVLFTAQIDYFYSPGCEECAIIKDSILPILRAKNITIKYYNIETDSGYKHLLEIEKKYGSYVDKFPAMLIGDKLLVGIDEIRRINKFIEHPDTPVIENSFSIPETNPTNPIRFPIPVASILINFKIAYFYTPGCKECSRCEHILSNLEHDFPNIEITRFNIADRNNMVLFDNLCKEYKVVENLHLVTPAIFIGDTSFIKEIRDEDIYHFIHTSKPSRYQWEKFKPVEHPAMAVTENGIIKRFVGLSPIGIIGAGLLDGINPCAFATIIFFISYLTFAAYRRREILLVGMSFAIAVFIAYFCIGVGIFKFVSMIKVFPILSEIVYYAIAGLTFVLGLVSLYDYRLYKKGRTAEMKLQLPTPVKKVIHKVIRSEIEDRRQKTEDRRQKTEDRGQKTEDRRRKTEDRGQKTDIHIWLICVSAFISGLIVSVLEVVCTGQVYLPTITYILSIPMLRAKAIYYLLMYNLFFILPLVFVFLVAYFGISSQKMSEIMKRKLGIVKLATACLFFGLASLLILLKV